MEVGLGQSTLKPRYVGPLGLQAAEHHSGQSLNKLHTNVSWRNTGGKKQPAPPVNDSPREEAEFPPAESKT